jgi:formylglycine-generating enzyme required for sulfatase activity
MDTLASPRVALDREFLADRYRRNRARSAHLFGLVGPQAYTERPIPLRHPFVFYEGHLPAFSFLTLNERALQQEPVDARLEKLFERGIDPATLDIAGRQARADWPSKPDVAAFGNACDERVYEAIAQSHLSDATVPRLDRGQALYTILEHEQMHHETLVYLIHQLDASRKQRVAQVHRDSAPPHNDIVAIAEGTATLGADPGEIAFGWDNEFRKVRTEAPAFGIQRYPVTNRDWKRFVEDGGPMPPFWIARDGGLYVRGVFEEIPLPESWPVCATHDQAEAYARWAGMRLPTEAEYHRAAFGTAGGEERPFPWGNDEPQARHGNFDFVRFDPEPVDAHPDGASAWGIHDLVGNGWEWTSTIFGPHPGFAPMASYPQYSTDFFDGKHYVMKGASPVTARELIRRSFRNWFYGDYPYMYAKFRCVA